MAVQTNGKIVVTAASWQWTDYDFTLARYNRNGSVDEGFGKRGAVTTDFGRGDDYPLGLALERDGKIVVGGVAWSGTDFDFAVARYRPDGSPDNSFGRNGLTTTRLSEYPDVAYGLALQPDGKIVLAGTIQGLDEIALTRYTVDGALDPAFGQRGKVTTRINPGGDVAFSVVVLPDGKIVVGGEDGGRKFALTRYNADGSLDPTFGRGGRVTTQPLGSDESRVLALALQRRGKIVAAGYSGAAGEAFDFALARYTSGGALDTTFGKSGTVITKVRSLDDVIDAVAVQRDGKIVVAGDSGRPSDHGFDVVLARYRPNGSLDEEFGAAGLVTTSVAGSCCAYARALSIQRDGKIVAAGGIRDAGQPLYDVAIFRYYGLQCEVPNVRGRKLAKAKRSIRRAWCSVGRTRRAFSGAVKKGHVVRQRPRPETRLGVGARVKLIVSAGRRRARQSTAK